MTMSGPMNNEHIPYYTQKIALEHASLELAQTSLWPKITLVRPGEVHTGDHSGPLAFKDVNTYAETIINIIESAPKGLRVYEFSLGVDYE